MPNTATVHARIDPALKENAENILSQLGLTSSDAIKLFYRQIELTGGLPFEIKIPVNSLAEMNLFNQLSIGETSAEKGKWITLTESKKDLGI
ncbi:MAG: type II toxin-antitoxin system RelB/DinJ family antitoxin [Clostridia bacterium]|nr:type II toxin-antitoxin system RelB/DinJ family antitoxin [Clostridia bacterium]